MSRIEVALGLLAPLASQAATSGSSGSGRGDRVTRVKRVPSIRLRHKGHLKRGSGSDGLHSYASSTSSSGRTTPRGPCRAVGDSALLAAAQQHVVGQARVGTETGVGQPPLGARDPGGAAGDREESDVHRCVAVTVWQRSK